MLLSWVLFAAVVGVFSSYINFSSASIALNILQLTESAECNELKDENTKSTMCILAFSSFSAEISDLR